MAFSISCVICKWNSGIIRNNTANLIVSLPISCSLLTRQGIFPWLNRGEGEIRWCSPDPRAIIALDAFNVSRSLRQILKKRLFEVRWNTAFEEVMRQCSRRDETWISEEIIQSYTELHRQGYAHSLEMWQNESLAADYTALPSEPRSSGNRCSAMYGMLPR